MQRTPRQRPQPRARRRSTRVVRLVTTELQRCAPRDGVRVTGPEVAARVLMDRIGRKDREHLVVLHLDGRHRVAAVETVAVGTLTAALVHPREVFKGALLANAAALLVGHNHPSGDLEPSAEDLASRSRLAEAGALLGIPVLDYLIVSRDDYRALGAPD